MKFWLDDPESRAKHRKELLYNWRVEDELCRDAVAVLDAYEKLRAENQRLREVLDTIANSSRTSAHHCASLATVALINAALGSSNP